MPDRKVNVLTPAIFVELGQGLDRVAAAGKFQVLLVRSGKPDHFCAGADVTEIPEDGRVVYEEPYLSTYPQWEAPQEGTPPFRTMTKPILTAVKYLDAHVADVLR